MFNEEKIKWFNIVVLIFVMLYIQMIDLEFVYMGFLVFDIGVFLVNYIFFYYGYMFILEDNDRYWKFVQKMIEVCKLIGVLQYVLIM